MSDLVALMVIRLTPEGFFSTFAVHLYLYILFVLFIIRFGIASLLCSFGYVLIFFSYVFVFVLRIASCVCLFFLLQIASLARFVFSYTLFVSYSFSFDPYYMLFSFFFSFVCLVVALTLRTMWFKE